MANQSIFDAFERMWQHIVAVLDNKSDSDHSHDEFIKTEAQTLTDEQKKQVRRNLGLLNTIKVNPSITGFIRADDRASVSQSANYLRTDYLDIRGYQSIEYNSWILSSSGMASWALYDDQKARLAVSDDEQGDDYYHVDGEGNPLHFGYKKNTLIMSDILSQYPTAAYIIMSTGVVSGYESRLDENGENVGWGGSAAYIKLISDGICGCSESSDDDSESSGGNSESIEGAVLYNASQELSSEEQDRARNNIGITSIGSNYSNRKYVEEFKTSSNTWDDAFADLISYCTVNKCTACADGSYNLSEPLKIGDINVDFEKAAITNNPTTDACIILTGATQKEFRFGVVTAQNGIGLLVNTESGKFEYNRVYANTIRGFINALAIVTTNKICNFNEFHAMRLRSSQIPLRVYCETAAEHWVNECYFYLSALETYRSDDGYLPNKLIEMTNTTRCNIYNLDIEQPLANPDSDPAIELTNCQTIAFFNPRTAEPSNAVQFRFIGTSFNNFVDAEYCKYATIDCSQMANSDCNYNVFRGAVITTNSGDVTNCNTLRVYKDMIVPMTLTKYARVISDDYEINHTQIMNLYNFPGNANGATVFGVPTMYEWEGGNITVNKRFIALLPSTLQIKRISDSVGNILDEDGNLIVEGTNLTLNKKYDICVDSYDYELVVSGESSKRYKCLKDIVISLDSASASDTMDSIKSTSDEFYIADNNGNAILRVDDNGLHSTGLSIQGENILDIINSVVDEAVKKYHTDAEVGEDESGGDEDLGDESGGEITITVKQSGAPVSFNLSTPVRMTSNTGYQVINMSTGNSNLVRLRKVPYGEYTIQADPIEMDGYRVVASHTLVMGENTYLDTKNFTLSRENHTVHMTIDYYIIDERGSLIIDKLFENDFNPGNLYSINVCVANENDDRVISPIVIGADSVCRVPINTVITVTEVTDDAQVEGYTLDTKYEIALSGQELAEGNTIMLTTESPEGTFVITNSYTPIVEA